MSDMTKEERMERARAKVDRLRAVSQTRGRGADRMDWKPKAKIYVHPDTELHDRLRVWFPREVEDRDEKGKETGKKKVLSLPFNVPSDPKACPFQTLRNILREREDIDADETILSVGSGRGKVELVKGEILGLDGYDYRRSLRPNADFVCAAIKVGDAKGKRPDKLKIEILAGAKTLAAEIRKEIDSEMDESGEEAGNPFFNPYPFIIEFHQQEKGSDMYSARARVQEGPGDDEELNALLAAEPADLEEEIKLSDVEDMMKALTAALVRDDIEIVLEGGDEEPSTPKKKADQKKAERAAAPPAAPKKKKVAEPEEEEEPAEEPAEEEPAEEELEPEEEPAEEPEPEPEPTPRRKAESKPAAKPDVKTAPKPAAPKPAAPKPADKPAATPKETVRREKKAETAPKKQLGWVPKEGEPYDECPVCNEFVPQTAKECPHPGCGAKYQSDDAEF